MGGYGRRGSPGDVRGRTLNPSRLAAALLGPCSGLPAGLVTSVSVPSDLPSRAVLLGAKCTHVCCLLMAFERRFRPLGDMQGFPLPSSAFSLITHYFLHVWFLTALK